MFISQEWTNADQIWDSVFRIITTIEPLKVVLHKVDLEKWPHMGYLTFMLISIEEIKKAFNKLFLHPELFLHPSKSEVKKVYTNHQS